MEITKKLNNRHLIQFMEFILIAQNPSDNLLPGKVGQPAFMPVFSFQPDCNQNNFIRNCIT